MRSVQIRPCTVQADLLDTSNLPRMIEETLQEFGQLDALVNNASSFYPTSLVEASEEDWNDLLGTNLKAPLFLAQAAATELRRYAMAAIVNIVDIHAERPMPGHLIYNIAKSGLASLTRALAQELAPHVRVNGVAPGVILWPESPLWQDDKPARRHCATHAAQARRRAGRHCQSREIFNCPMHPISPDR